MRKLLLIAGLLTLLVATNARGYTFQSVYPLYHTFTERVTWANDFSAANPDLVRLVQFGTTDQGRPLLALNLTVNPQLNDPRKPEFLFTAGIHAREVVTSDAAMRLAETLVGGYRSGAPSFLDILSERDVWIVPDLNPDGRVLVEAGRSDQRKNAHWYAGQDTNNSTCGVDLNRNFTHKWNLASSNVRDDTYRGPAPLSERESSSLWDLLHDQTRFSHLLASIDIHSGTEAILSPWTSPTEFANYPLPPADRQKFDFLAGRMHDLTGFSTDRLWYDNYGTVPDSFYEEFHAYALTEEIFGGPFEDYFTYFNPIDQPTRDDRITKAVNSALFLLSDEAFVLPEPSALVWQGGLSGAWDVNTTANFGGSASGKYWDGDHMTFNDTGSRTVIAIAAGGVAPGSVVFSNTTAKDYSLGGGPIEGPTSLVVSGGGRVTLDSGNTYTGGTVVSNGTLEIASANSLPAGKSLAIGAQGTVVLSSGLSAGAVNAVPEPGTTLLLTCGILVALVTWLRKCRKAGQ